MFRRSQPEQVGPALRAPVFRLIGPLQPPVHRSSCAQVPPREPRSALPAEAVSPLRLLAVPTGRMSIFLRPAALSRARASESIFGSSPASRLSPHPLLPSRLSVQLRQFSVSQPPRAWPAPRARADSLEAVAYRSASARESARLRSEQSGAAAGLHNAFPPVVAFVR